MAATTEKRPSLLMNIGDMIDLSIGSPENGVVDFNMLHTVLHCLAQQLKVLSKTVELRGDIALVPVGDMEGMKTILIDEKQVEADGAAPGGAGQDTLLLIEKIPKLEAEATKASPLKPGKAGQASDWKRSGKEVGAKGSKTAAKAKGGRQEGGEKEEKPKAVTSGESLSLVTMSKFNILEGIVSDLKNRVYGSIPKNEDIIEEVRSQTNMKSITDLWTSLNVSSRLEAAESAIDRLSSLLEDLIGESNSLRDAIKTCQSSMTAMDAVKHAVRDANAMKLREAKAIAQAAAEGPGSASAPATPTAPTSGGQAAMSGGAEAKALKNLAPGTTGDIATIQGVVMELRDDLDKLTNDFYTNPVITGKAAPGVANFEGFDKMMSMDTAASTGKSSGGQSAALSPGVPGTPVDAASAGGTIASTGPAVAGMGAAGAKVDPAVYNMMLRVNDIDNRIKDCCDSMKKNNGKLSDQIINLQDQVEGVLKQMADVTEGFETGLSKDMIKDLKGLMQLFHTVQEMQQELKQVHDTALQLAAEKEHRQQNLNAIVDQIELLKTIKMDREDILEAMAEKADVSAMARKVSFDQFELACDDLSKGLEHTLGKLGLQEAIWQRALDDIQREIEAKLDKMELMPVKDFFNTKLRELQESLKQISMLRREAEAAGTKRKLLRDVNCISCDAKACMQTEPASVAVQRPFPATLSMKPYLSYELDSIRKTQQCTVPQRNMHDWEQIDKQTRVPQKVRSETDKHICNRYCGGSHTRTTPAQRVARTGHFIKQWGPDVLPLSSGMAAGDDGRMYKVSLTESQGDGPGGAAKPKSSPEKIGKRESFQKSLDSSQMATAQDCRCMEILESDKDKAKNGKERPVSAKV